jgi:hypothetical protein
MRMPPMPSPTKRNGSRHEQGVAGGEELPPPVPFFLTCTGQVYARSGSSRRKFWRQT